MIFPIKKITAISIRTYFDHSSHVIEYKFTQYLRKTRNFHNVNIWYLLFSHRFYNIFLLFFVILNKTQVMINSVTQFSNRKRETTVTTTQISV